MVSHWSLSDDKSPQDSRIVLSILGDLNNAVIYMVSTRPLISKSFKSLYQSFGDGAKSINYNCYHRHLHVSQFF